MKTWRLYCLSQYSVNVIVDFLHSLCHGLVKCGGQLVFTVTLLGLFVVVQRLLLRAKFPKVVQLFLSDLLNFTM